MTSKDHTYKGQQIVRSQYLDNKRWQIVGYHESGSRWGEEAGNGSGYYTLAEARAAIDGEQKV